ncbi:putative glycerol kinase 3 [Operophtera brumata]|uniref:glycerol kinase n=1 Tax=Operophtera brumata TaxID=104452 RepID=A0A0L7L746_OPEBR|nr:putative glycerol kinase 3 [Operophtera brumata]
MEKIELRTYHSTLALRSIFACAETSPPSDVLSERLRLGRRLVHDAEREGEQVVDERGVRLAAVRAIYEAERTEELASYQIDKTEVQPKEGWYEQDPLEIMHHIRLTVDSILAKVPDRNKNYLKHICGLPISPYFSALKMRWLKDNSKPVRRASRDKRLLFGTVDSWILWNLTGGVFGGLHATDVTNASRTLLMNLDTLNWDPMLCSGCFLLYNTGHRRVHSTHGLLTTLAYKMGPDAPPVYALEGSIAVAGGGMKFLRDNLHLIKDVAQDTEHIAGQVFSTGDVYFVPAFSGLYAPYWRKDARGVHHQEPHHQGGAGSVRAHSWDMSALGVAIAAGNAVGAWSFESWKRHAASADTFLPTTTDDGQRRKSSFLPSFDNLSPPGSRKNSCDTPTDYIDPSIVPIDDENTYVDELNKYSARKFSMFFPLKRKVMERTILDDAEYFMSKKECDYGMCECCHLEKKLLTNWKSIEEIIENDPEIIFDCDDNPIVVEPVRESSYDSGTSLVGASKKLNQEKMPLFKTVSTKISDSSIS